MYNCHPDENVEYRALPVFFTGKSFFPFTALMQYLMVKYWFDRHLLVCLICAENSLFLQERFCLA